MYIDKMTKNTKALAIRDGLDLYFNDIRNIPVLSREQEHELAMKWYKDRDREAGQLLVISNLRFVVKVAHEYTKYGLKLSDLVQEGNMGLMHALDKFDPTKGYRLISYAVWWIRAYIQSFVLRSWSMVRMGTTRSQRKIFSSLQKARAQIRALTGGEPATNQQLAEALDVSESDLEETVQRMKVRDISMEQPIHANQEATFGESVADDVPTVEDQMIQSNIQQLVREKLDDVYEDLAPRERYILDKRLLSDNPVTLEAIGQDWGVSRERVRQIEARLKAKLRHVFPSDLAA